MATTETPLEAYRRLESEGEVRADDDQLRVLKHFDRLYQDLLDYPEVATKSRSLSIKSWRLSTLFKWGNNEKGVPKGLYVYGGVGRGKSMLMDSTRRR